MINFKDNAAEVKHKGAAVVIETLSVVDEVGNIYIFDIAGQNLDNVDKFISAGCLRDTADEYGGKLL